MGVPMHAVRSSPAANEDSLEALWQLAVKYNKRDQYELLRRTLDRMRDLEMDINHVQADMLHGDDDYIVHQTNCVTSTAAGLAKRMFTDLPYSDVYKGREHHSCPGSIQIMGDGNERRLVVNLFGQFAPGKAKPKGIDSAANRLRYFRQGLTTLADYIAARHPEKTTSIGFPANIGCGMAGGDWTQYEKEITAFATSLYARGRTDKVKIYHLKAKPSRAEASSSRNIPPIPPREPDPVLMTPSTLSEGQNPKQERGKRPTRVPNRGCQTKATNAPSSTTTKITNTNSAPTTSMTTTTRHSSGDRRPPEEWHPAKRAHYLDADEYKEINLHKMQDLITADASNYVRARVNAFASRPVTRTARSTQRTRASVGQNMRALVAAHMQMHERSEVPIRSILATNFQFIMMMWLTAADVRRNSV